MLGVINILLPVSFLEDIVIDLREKDTQNETIKKKKNETIMWKRVQEVMSLCLKMSSSIFRLAHSDFKIYMSILL